jgi:Phage Tail Collar Domain
MTNYVVSTPVNGTFEVPDDQINSAQLAINLIGRGVTNYGQAVAQNDINLLQNFAGPTPPIKPIIGQLWFNSTTLYLQVYTSAGTWTPVAFEPDLSNYATVTQLASTNAALNTLASTSAAKVDLNNYVKVTSLYSPPANATPVPTASGGTGLITVGTAGQVLTVNSFGTGLTYATPASSYQYPTLAITSSTTLSDPNLGSVCNINTAGITVTLPLAVRCPSGRFLAFTFLVAGTATIASQSGDSILSGAGVVGQTTGASYTIYAGEEVTFISDGISKWATLSQSRTVTTTPTVGDNSLKLANTAFVQGSLAPYLLSSTAGATYAPLVSPVFSGSPQVPTPAIADSSALIPNTYWVSQRGLQLVPPGAIMCFATPYAPTGWLQANGANVGRVAYAGLFAAIGGTWGVGDGSTTFTLPDLRGLFIRAWDNSRGVDPSRGFGTVQGSAFASHTHVGATDAQGVHAHSASTDGQGTHSHGGGTGSVGDHTHALPNIGSVQAGGDNGGANSPVDTGYGSSRNQNPTSAAGGHNHSIPLDGLHAHNVAIANAGSHAHNVTVYATGDVETRPINMALLYCIKY